MKYNYLFAVAALAMLAPEGCDENHSQPKSASGVTKAEVKVPVGPDNLTAEQRNVRDRLLKDNEPGAIKHLYVISAYSGQVLIYSTVRGKVTSGGKRLTPSEVASLSNEGSFIPVSIAGYEYRTKEVLGDDGAYGSSGDYIFWFGSNGSYHQHYLSGGQIVHVSDQPLSVKGVVVNMELTVKPGENPPAESALPHPAGK